ncbi:hypothetical protein LCGC14_0884340 [marine sediment metagenome]|uniref:Uncharacterized protein n=1 Tax=marine sediment metagenome TaxID=412755 RepID=A0A0F9P5W2_9ZZZZ
MAILHWLNRKFGKRRYFKRNGIAYIQEGTNESEELLEHLKREHPEEYQKHVVKTQIGI